MSSPAYFVGKAKSILDNKDEAFIRAMYELFLNARTVTISDEQRAILGCVELFNSYTDLREWNHPDVKIYIFGESFGETTSHFQVRDDNWEPIVEGGIGSITLYKNVDLILCGLRAIWADLT